LDLLAKSCKVDLLFLSNLHKLNFANNTAFVNSKLLFLLQICSETLTRLVVLQLSYLYFSQS
jgi:hypothetical protein